MNAEKLAANLNKAAKDFASAKDVLAPIALLVVGAAQRNAPVRTGTLRRSITYRIEGNAAYVGTAVEYARYVHDGTRYMVGRPFLTQGIEESRDGIESKLSEWGGKVLDKVGK